MKSILSAVILCSALVAQAQEVVSPALVSPEYPRFGSREYLRTLFSEAQPRFDLQGPIRLADYQREDRLRLTLKDYLELVLANNTDIQIQKLIIEIPRNNITRTFSVFDPTLLTRFQATRSLTPTTDALQGAATLSTLNQPFTVGYNQFLDTGAQVSVNYLGSRFATNNSFAQFNPAFNSNLGMAISQPLLRGRGRDVNRAPILIARSRFAASEHQFQDILLRLVVQAENAYWDLVGAKENLRVQEKALELATASLKRAERELELGALPQLEIYQPQAVKARAEIFVTQARYRVAQTEDALRRQAGMDLDPAFRLMPLELVEPALPPADQKALDREAMVNDAIRLRPDLAVVRENLKADDLSLKLNANNLRPDLSVGLNYITQGRGGPQVVRGNLFNPDGSTSPVRTVLPGGLGDALTQTFGFNFPVYGGTLTLRLPLRDRSASANYADAVVTKRLDLLRQRVAEQNVRLEVLNAVTQVENSRASVDLARIAYDLAQKRVEADQRRYELGAITLFFLLDSQNALVQAESDLVNQSILYRRNLLNLYQRQGTLLTERGVKLN
jgi:outer membrane protein